MGGLARLASIINERRKDDSSTITLDYGNSISDINDLRFLKDKKIAFKKAKLVMSTYSKLRYDALNIGESELACGIANLKKWTVKPLKLISANILSAKNNKHFFEPFLVKKIDGIRYLITGIFPSNYIPYLKGTIKKEKIKITDPSKEVEKIITENKGRFDFVIVLSSLTQRNTEKFRGKTKNLALIIGSKNFRPIYSAKETVAPPITANQPKLNILSILNIEISDKSKELVLIPEMARMEKLAASYKRNINRISAMKSSSPWKERQLKTLKERSSRLNERLKTLKARSNVKDSNLIIQQTVVLDKSIKDDPETRRNLDKFASGGKNVHS